MEVDGLVKIGFTTRDAKARRAELKGKILALVRGTHSDELAYHRRFAPHLAHGREYFRPAPDLMCHISTLRRLASGGRVRHDVAYSG